MDSTGGWTKESSSMAGDGYSPGVSTSGRAEGPDSASAVSFLLNEVRGRGGDNPAALLRFVPAPPQESLVFVDQIGMRSDEARQFPDSLEDAAHPLMVCALSLTPVVRASERVVRVGRFGPFHEWSALPLPQPHYRGAPAQMSDSHAQNILASSGARLVPLKERSLNAAPGGVVVVAATLNDDVVRELADFTMLAGSTLARTASLAAD